MQLSKQERLKRRHLRVRKKVAGTTERPRVMVRKTLKHLYLVVVDDTPEGGSKTIATYTTATKANAGKHFANAAGAIALGKLAAADLKSRGIEAVTYDRGGYRYHGIVKTLADSIREAGVTI
ncbi:50S ribosomal protein L18 [bacterium]|nr:50S ribosomal protein L18 [bacterium]